MKYAQVFVAGLLSAGCVAQVDDGEGPVDPANLVCNAPGTYDAVEPSTRWARTTTPDGWPMVSYIPPKPVALMFYFHGTGGNADDVYNLEVARELDTLVDLGIGLVATQSEDRNVNVQWDIRNADWTTNPDLVRLEGIYDSLIASGQITAETPVVTNGFSQGGSMSGYFGALAAERGWPVVAIARHSSAGNESPGIPQIWVVAANDLEGTADRAEESYQEAIAAGGIGEFYLAVEQPLDPMRFVRIPGFEEQTSQKAFDEAVGLSLVDAAGVRLVDLSFQLENAIALYEAEAEVIQNWEVGNQLRVVWSTHRFDSQFTEQVCDFVLRELQADSP